jgi:acetyltransferase-like isoleucine patch superfamily enzyme
VPSIRELLRVRPVVTGRSRGKLVLHRNTKVHVARSAALDIRGRLVLGRQWDNGAPALPGYFLVQEDARVEVHGLFQAYSGLRVEVGPGASLSIGSGFSNSELRLTCREEIRIGEDVMFAEGVLIRDSDDHPVNDNGRVTAPIVIEDHVWVGMRAMVLKGVTIGRGSIVAAGAVVVRDVPPASLVAGVPATVRRQGVSWSH